MDFTWERRTGLYQNGESLYLNRILLGSCNWGTMASGYEGNIDLPSLKTETIYGSSPEEVKARMEDVVIRWFDEALRK